MTQTPRSLNVRAPDARGWQRIVCLGLVFLTFLPALRSGFLWCDDYTVSASPLMQGLAGLKKIWAGGATEQYYPWTYSLHFAMYQMFGATPLPHHLLNLLLHTVNAALAAAIFSRIRPRLALSSAVLFAVHPLQVESVVWVYELKNVWSGLWMLLAAWLHLCFVESGRPRLLVYAMLCFFLALLAKSATLVYPGVALLLFVAREQRDPSTDRRAFASLVPFVVAALGAALWTVWYERHQTLAGGIEYPQHIAERARLAGRVFWFYLGRILLPVRLSFAYGRFELADASLLDWLPALLMVVACLAIATWRRRAFGHALFLAASAYLVTVAPVLGLFDIYMFRYTYVADHLAYLPVLCVAPALVALAQGLPDRLRGFRIEWVLISACSALSVNRALLFVDEAALWRDAADKSDRAWLASLQVARIAREHGHPFEAEEFFRKSLAAGESAEAHAGWGDLCASQGRFLDALDHYGRAIALAPRDTRVLHNAGSLLAGEGRLVHALEHYQRIVDLDPGDEIARRDRDGLRATLDELLRDLPKARERLQDPVLPIAELLDVCDRCVAVGREDLAREALDLRWKQSNDARIGEKLARLLLTSVDEKVRDVSRALTMVMALLERTRESVASVHEVAAYALGASRRLAESAEHYRRAAALYEAEQELERARICTSRAMSLTDASL